MNETNKKRAYDRILQDIISGAFQDEPVLNERRLIERYSIGKTPIRDALVQLCGERVLRVIPRYGYEILQLTEQDIANVLQFREMLECQSLRTTAPALPRETLEGFSAFVEAEGSRLAQADVWEAWESNTRVHVRLLSLGGNRYSAEVLRGSMAILKRAYAQVYNSQQNIHRPDSFSDEIHRELCAALLEGDFERAIDRLREDIYSFERLHFTA